ASVTIGDAVPVRGQPQPAVLVAARVKLVDRKTHQVLGQGAAGAAGPAGGARHGIGRGLAGGVAGGAPPAPEKRAQAGSGRRGGEPGVVLLRLSSKTPYALVLAEQKYLAGAKGVHGATLRRLSPSGWVIGVQSSEAIERIAQIAKKPPASDVSSSVKIVGEVVE